MVITENILLSSYTTFRIGGPARFFCIAKKESDIVEAIIFAKEKNIPFFVLGGGSNILISDEGYKGLVIKNEIMGVEIDKKDKEFLEKVLAGSSLKGCVTFRVGAGENWDDFVDMSVKQGYFGIENLSSIPGVVGAVPVQNIGAYGTDISSVIVNVRAYDVSQQKFIDLNNKDCEFEYRNSLFKKNKGSYIITRVDFRLDKQGKVDISYKDLQNYFLARKIESPKLKQVRDAVVDIRSAKLPDWKKWGTAGSFFKNPIISKESFGELKSKYPELPGYPEPSGKIKVALGWILDKVCNAKGLTIGNAFTYEKQALVLVSKPGATATEVVKLSEELMRMVKDKTGIEIEAEVEWVN